MVDMELSVVEGFGRRRFWFYVSFSRSDFKEARSPQLQIWNYILDPHFSDFEQERWPILLAEFHTKRTEILQWGYAYNALLAFSAVYTQKMISP
jgi:hypothetical protein